MTKPRFQIIISLDQTDYDALEKLRELGYGNIEIWRLGVLAAQGIEENKDKGVKND